jgi:hypothetical protein
MMCESCAVGEFIICPECDNDVCDGCEDAHDCDGAEDDTEDENDADDEEISA